MLGEELVAAGGPGVALHDAAEVAVIVPAEAIVDRGTVNSGQVVSECFPGFLAVRAWSERLQDEKPVGYGQDVRGFQVAGGAERGQSSGLRPVQAGGGIGQGLHHYPGAVGEGDELDV